MYLRPDAACQDACKQPKIGRRHGKHMKTEELEVRLEHLNLYALSLNCQEFMVWLRY
jgi:hypothetical protein